MLVKALSDGYIGRYVYRDEVFEFPADQKLGVWMQPLEAFAEPTKTKDEPLFEIAKEKVALAKPAKPDKEETPIETKEAEPN